MSERPGGGNRDPRRGPGRGRGSGRPRVSPGSRPGSRARGGSQPSGSGHRQGPIGLARLHGEDFELIHPRGVEEMELDYEEGIELWKAGDPESARDALRYALSASHDNLWVHVALGRIALDEFRDPTLARGHFGYAFELAHRALPRGFSGRLPRERRNNRPFYEAIDGLLQCLEALGRPQDCLSLRTLRDTLSRGADP
jgi:hypothetical protein